MGKSLKECNNLPKIIVLLVVFGICAKLIMDYQLYGKYYDFGWRSKSLIVFVAIYALVDLFRETKKYFKKKKKE